MCVCVLMLLVTLRFKGQQSKRKEAGVTAHFRCSCLIWCPTILSKRTLAVLMAVPPVVYVRMESCFSNHVAGYTYIGADQYPLLSSRLFFCDI